MQTLTVCVKNLLKTNELGTKQKLRVTFTQQEIDKTINVYINKTEMESFSRLLDISGIENNNLNVDVYFDKKEVETDFGLFKVDNEKFEEKNTIEFGSIADFIRGSNLVKKVYEKEATHKAVMLYDVQNRELELENLTPINIDDINLNKKYLLKKGDVLLSCRGNVVKIAVIDEIPDNRILSHNFIAIRPDREVNTYFIKAYLESPIGKYYISKRLKGMTVLTLSVKDLYDMPFPNIDRKKQEDIGNKLIKSKEHYNQKLKEIKEQLKNDTIAIYSDLEINEVLNQI
ncbi:restriction endonuclease subunit S [Terrisporobacter hibernicus]|uniref:Restriction endonuclease subunit S n=1 Tax=Terrisporobacter hibernicus TaxID=2813371 RepID=A0AAX2ZE00_9FIRM|nr:restriction endonuclease subunit S [Terrisporobacter hibernicus]UEL47211.1 restriction endonuclease subunit S [Terrisporobacter hibernicus]